MFKISVAVVVGGALVLASDPASARFRVRISSPAAKAAPVQPPKPAVTSASKIQSGTSKTNVFVSVPLRPFAAAPRPLKAQSAAPALSDEAGARDIGTASASGDLPALTVMHAKEPGKDQESPKAQPAVTPAAAEPAKAQLAPGFAPARVASTSVRMVNHKAQPARAPIYCYVQPSGVCVPF